MLRDVRYGGARPAARPGVHRRRHADAGPRHRRHDRDVQRRERHPAPPAALPGPGSSRSSWCTRRPASGSASFWRRRRSTSVIAITAGRSKRSASGTGTARPVTVTGSGEPESVREPRGDARGARRSWAPIRSLGRSFNAGRRSPGKRADRHHLPRLLAAPFRRRRPAGTHADRGRRSARRSSACCPRRSGSSTTPRTSSILCSRCGRRARFRPVDGRGIARLKKGVTLREANADVARMIPILTQEFGRRGGFERHAFAPKLRWLKDTVVGDLGDTLWLLMGTIGLLLLIACANVANLVLVRTQTRRPELAIRAALGAGWARHRARGVHGKRRSGARWRRRRRRRRLRQPAAPAVARRRRSAADHDRDDRSHRAAGRRSGPRCSRPCLFALVPVLAARLADASR